MCPRRQTDSSSHRQRFSTVNACDRNVFILRHNQLAGQCASHQWLNYFRNERNCGCLSYCRHTAWKKNRTIWQKRKKKLHPKWDSMPVKSMSSYCLISRCRLIGWLHYRSERPVQSEWPDYMCHRSYWRHIYRFHSSSVPVFNAFHD